MRSCRRSAFGYQPDWVMAENGFAAADRQWHTEALGHGVAGQFPAREDQHARVAFESAGQGLRPLDAEPHAVDFAGRDRALWDGGEFCRAAEMFNPFRVDFMRCDVNPG